MSNPDNRLTYSLPAAWVDDTIHVALIGVGGNGSEMLDALGRMQLSLLAMGHPKGLHVEAFDPDTISPSNIVRQRFYPAEIGQNKAVTAIQRMNVYLGTEWDAHPVSVEEAGYQVASEYDLVIGCVDSVGARNTIADLRDESHSTQLYLDLGNGAHSGQVVLGHLSIGDGEGLRLPTVQDLFPEITEDEDDAPSCSAEESLLRQNFGVNRTMAAMAANLLWNLLTQGVIDHHGYFVDTRSGVTSPLRIDPALWASLAGRDLSTFALKDAA